MGASESFGHISSLSSKNIYKAVGLFETEADSDQTASVKAV